MWGDEQEQLSPRLLFIQDLLVAVIRLVDLLCNCGNDQTPHNPFLLSFLHTVSLKQLDQRFCRHIQYRT